MRSRLPARRALEGRRQTGRSPLRLRHLLTVALTILAYVSSTGTAHAIPKREPQDYGRPKPDAPRADAEAAMWVPRVVLFPLWLLSEYVIRIPIGALVKVAERDEWAQEVVEFFTFGERKQFTIFPSALFDFGLLPSVGFNATWKYFLADPNTIRLHFGTWGLDWISTRLVDTYDFGHGESLSVDTSFVRRKDNPFYGMGPRSPQEGRLRYQSTTISGAIEYENRFWRSSLFSAHAGARSVGFGEGTCCGQDSIATAVADGRIPAPPGFEQNYIAGFHRLAFELDSRKPRPESGSGARIEAHGEAGFSPKAGESRSWIRYGGAVGGALDLTGTQRVISLTADAEFADPLTGTVPFTEQVTLGGDMLMRGYLRNRLIDRSAFVASLRYTWPIWVYLDGVIHADVGNVFGAHLKDFDLGLLRLTSGIGVRSNGARESGFEILVAGGTDPFEQGFSVSSFRFVIGSHHGF